jgi:hypothetical protein
MQGFDPTQIEKVACGSSVDHMICFGCEAKWRKQTPMQYGLRGPERIMKCPTCHQTEGKRTNASLQREAFAERVESTARTIQLVRKMKASGRVPPRQAILESAVRYARLCQEKLLHGVEYVRRREAEQRNARRLLLRRRREERAARKERAVAEPPHLNDKLIVTD